MRTIKDYLINSPEKNMSNYYLILNTRLEVIATSPLWEKICKYEHKHLIGAPIFSIFSVNENKLNITDINNIKNSLKNVLKSKKSHELMVKKYPLSLEDKNDKEKGYCKIKNIPTFDKNKKVLYIIHNIEDIKETITDDETKTADTTLKCQTNDTMNESDKFLRLFVNSCRDYALLILDSQGYIISWNTGAEEIKGYKEKEIIGKHFSIFYPEEAVKNHYPAYELKMASKNGHYEDNGWRIRKDGSKFWANVIITALKDSSGNTIGYGKVTKDLTERREFEEKIIYLSTHDMLTGLHNRVSFHQTLSKELDKAASNNTITAVLILDIDNFKVINDNFGHYGGDQLLIQVAKQLQKYVGKDYFVARLGGDEFVIIIPDLKNEIDIKTFAKNLIKRFEKPFFIENHFLYSTVSIGIAISGQEGRDFTTMIKNADIALYSVKEVRRNSYQIFSEEINSVFKKRVELQNQLPDALVNNELFLVYQPQYNLFNRKIVGIETLIRWQHPRLGVIPPNDFIPVAEKSGIIVQLGEWVLKTAIDQYMQWLSKDLISDKVKLCVNVSPVQLSADNFLESFISIINNSKILPNNLELELTETAIMLNSVDLDYIFNQLKTLGISIAIDDFGTGYSSLSRIKQLPVSTLKIDRFFINSIDKNKDNATIVKSIISLGKSLGLKIISEGVETEEQLKLLLKYRCEIVQGFYFGKRPFYVDEMTNILSDLAKKDTDGDLT